MEKLKNWWKFIVLYEIRRQWKLRYVWWIIKLIPRDVKKWIVVQSAVRAHDGDGSPAEVTYEMMAKVWEKK